MRRDVSEAENPLLRHRDMVYRVAFSNVKNKADAEDVVQETCVRYLNTQPEFQNEEHEKAWFIRVADRKSTRLNSSH